MRGFGQAPHFQNIVGIIFGREYAGGKKYFAPGVSAKY